MTSGRSLAGFAGSHPHPGEQSETVNTQPGCRTAGAASGGYQTGTYSRRAAAICVSAGTRSLPSSSAIAWHRCSRSSRSSSSSRQLRLRFAGGAVRRRHAAVRDQGPPRPRLRLPDDLPDVRRVPASDPRPVGRPPWARPITVLLERAGRRPRRRPTFEAAVLGNADKREARAGDTRRRVSASSIEAGGPGRVDNPTDFAISVSSSIDR
jgi:hypothetical protein